MDRHGNKATNRLTNRQIVLIVVGVILILIVIGFFSRAGRRATPVVRVTTQQQVSPGQNRAIVGRRYLPPLAAPSVAPGYRPGVRPPSPSVSAPYPGTPDRETVFVLYYFYHPQCLHCQQFHPIWNSIVERLKVNEDISLRAIDASNPQNEDLTFHYNVDKYPTLILVTPSGKMEYAGSRTEHDVSNFVYQQMNQY